MSSNPANSKHNTNNYTKNGLEMDEVRFLKETFDSFDHKHQNKISTEELLNIMKKEKFDEKNPMVYQMLDDLCRNDDESIDFEEFVSLMNTKINAKSEDELKRLFKIFDKDDKGEISIYDLRNVARDLGEQFSDQELADIIQTADVDKDGKLGYRDFCKIMGNKVFN